MAAGHASVKVTAFPFPAPSVASHLSRVAVVVNSPQFSSVHSDIFESKATSAPRGNAFSRPVCHVYTRLREENWIRTQVSNQGDPVGEAEGGDPGERDHFLCPPWSSLSRDLPALQAQPHLGLCDCVFVYACMCVCVGARSDPGGDLCDV